MAFLFPAKEFLIGVAFMILVSVALAAFVKFLQSREGKKLMRQQQIGGSNRAQRRKERALSRRRKD